MSLMLGMRGLFVSGWGCPLCKCVCEGGASVYIHAKFGDKVCPQACVFMAILRVRPEMCVWLREHWGECLMY